jgi:hypothetical protein
MFAFIKRNNSDAKFLALQSLYHIFSDLHRKVSKTLICNISLEKKTTCLSVLKNVPMLGETNNQFYMALVTINLIGRSPPLPIPNRKIL